MHLPDANLPVTRSLSTRMARWGLVIVGMYLLVALITPLLVSAGVLPDANAGLENPIYSAPSWTHWCGTCLLYTSPSPRDRSLSRMPSSA